MSNRECWILNYGSCPEVVRLMKRDTMLHLYCRNGKIDECSVNAVFPHGEWKKRGGEWDILAWRVAQ